MAVLAAAAPLAALLSGCHTCENHKKSAESLELAEIPYKNGRYDQAKQLYSRCVEMCAENVEGWLGLANA